MTEKPTAPKPAAKAPANTSANNKTKSRPYLLIFSIIFLFILSLAALSLSAYLAYQGQQLRNQVLSQNAALAELQALDQQPIIQNLMSEVTTQETNIQQLQDNYNQRFEEWKILYNKQLSLADRKRDDWYLNEVAYLMRLAATRLYLINDVNTATAALEQADLRLSELENPIYLQVRKQLSDEISSLRELKLPDVDGTLLQLERLLATVANMPLAQPSASASNNEMQADNDATNQKSLSLSNMLSLLGFSQKQDDLNPLTRRENTLFIYQIVQLEIESAKQALVRYDKDDFDMHINNITNLLNKHYQPNNQQVMQAIAQIESIDNLTVFPDFPDITLSLNLLQSLINRYDIDESDLEQNNTDIITDTPDNNATEVL